MPRLLVLLLAFSFFSATLYGQEAKPSSAVKPIVEKAVAEVKRNRQEFDKANEKPLGDAREELQGLFQKLVDGGKSEEAQAVVKQMETLQADVLRMASGGEKPTLKPAVKTILEKALREVRKNRDAFDKANQKPLGSAREQLQELAKQQAGEGKTKDASASLQQIETLTRDVMRLAEAPVPVAGGAGPQKPLLERMAGKWRGENSGFTIQPNGEVQKADGNHGVLVLASPDVAEMTWRSGEKVRLRIVDENKIAVTGFDKKGKPFAGILWERVE